MFVWILQEKPHNGGHVIGIYPSRVEAKRARVDFPGCVITVRELEFEEEDDPYDFSSLENRDLPY